MISLLWLLGWCYVSVTVHTPLYQFFPWKKKKWLANSIFFQFTVCLKIQWLIMASLKLFFQHQRLVKVNVNGKRNAVWDCCIKAIHKIICRSTPELVFGTNTIDILPHKLANHRLKYGIFHCINYMSNSLSPLYQFWERFWIKWCQWKIMHNEDLLL